MEPILTYSEITGCVYIVTKYRRLDGGVIDAREKFDVTDWVESYAKKCNAQTVEENAKLRELAVGMYGMFKMLDKILGNHDACETPRPLIFGEDKSFKDVMRELGMEVPDV